MQKNIIRASALAAALVLLQGCSWFRDKPPEYLDSREVDRLTVPEDLDAPQYRSPLVITAPQMRLPTGDELNPAPPRVVSTQGAGDARAFMAWSAEGAYLQVRDPQAEVAQELGPAITESGMRMLESGENGRYRFEYEHLRIDTRSFWQKLAFWNDGLGPDHSGVYRTRVEPDGQESRIYLLFDSGEQATTDAAQNVLGVLMEHLQ